MKTVRNLLIIALALLLQSTVMGRYDIRGVAPDLALLALIYIASTSSATESIFLGFLIGFFQDVYTPEYLGANAFTMSLIGFLLGFLRERFTVENISVRFIVTFLVCIVHDVMYFSLYAKFDYALAGGLLLRQSLGGALYTSLLSIALIRIWEWAESGGLIAVIDELLGSGR